MGRGFDAPRHWQDSAFACRPRGGRRRENLSSPRVPSSRSSLPLARHAVMTLSVFPGLRSPCPVCSPPFHPRNGEGVSDHSIYADCAATRRAGGRKKSSLLRFEPLALLAASVHGFPNYVVLEKRLRRREPRPRCQRDGACMCVLDVISCMPLTLPWYIAGVIRGPTLFLLACWLYGHVILRGVLSKSTTFEFRRADTARFLPVHLLKVPEEEREYKGAV